MIAIDVVLIVVIVVSIAEVVVSVMVVNATGLSDLVVGLDVEP